MFKESLEAIVEKTDGSLGALVMGVDGLAVEKYLTDEGLVANLDVAAAQLTSVIRTAARSGNDLSLGDLREIIVGHESVNFVVRFFNHEYFAVLVLKPDGNLGRGRYELRKAELVLAEQFVI